MVCGLVPFTRYRMKVTAHARQRGSHDVTQLVHDGIGGVTVDGRTDEDGRSFFNILYCFNLLY